MKKIAIVGAGLVGSLHAILMAKKGYAVDVFERRPDLRKADLVGGRSINLALSDRGFKALELAGIADEIKEMSLPMYGRKMHDLKGNLTYMPYGKEGQAIYSVSRGGLNQRLMNLASEYDNITYRFNEKCKDIDLKTNTLKFENYESKEHKEFTYNQVFGTDGAFSAVRARLQRTSMFNYSQEYLSHGYKELEIPANPDGTHQMDKDCLHIWPRGEFMMIALPNLDGSFTCTLFFPMEGPVSFASLKTEADVQNFFEKTFPDSIPLMPDLLKDYFDNPTSSLVTIRCSPWNYEDKVLLMGDSSHAIVPFYGQGMNSGFEDCTLFDKMYKDTNADWDVLFESFSEYRKPDADAIANLALYNYIEMRDLSGDKDFLLRKKIEKKFSKLYPNKWMPLYSLVTFSHTRYSSALETGNEQRALMDEIMKMDNIHTNWDSQEVMDKLLELVG